MVRHLFDASNIRLSTDRRQHEAGVQLIAAMIAGTAGPMLGPRLHYLGEIVNNTFCLIDVDKWDYMVRDVHHLHVDAMAVPIDRTFVRCFDRARVVRLATSAGSDEPTHIAFHEHTLAAVRALFANRALMHRQCYQNVHVVGVEIVLRHVFRLAERAGYRFDGG